MNEVEQLVENMKNNITESETALDLYNALLTAFNIMKEALKLQGINIEEIIEGESVVLPDNVGQLKMTVAALALSSKLCIFEGNLFAMFFEHNGLSMDDYFDFISKIKEDKIKVTIN